MESRSCIKQSTNSLTVKENPINGASVRTTVSLPGDRLSSFSQSFRDCLEGSEGKDSVVSLPDELSMLSQPLTVSVLDTVKLDSTDLALSTVFSCLFCEHVCVGEINMSHHVAEVHRCRQQFSCTECDYGCMVRELFSLHAASHLCDSREGTGATEEDPSDTQHVTVKQELVCGLEQAVDASFVSEYSKTRDPSDTQHVTVKQEVVCGLEQAVDDSFVSEYSKTRNNQNNDHLIFSGSLNRFAVDDVHFDEVSSVERMTENEQVQDAKESCRSIGWRERTEGGVSRLATKRQNKATTVCESTQSSKNPKKPTVRFKTFREFEEILIRTPEAIVGLDAKSFDKGVKKFSCFKCDYVHKKFANFKDHFMSHDANLRSFVCKYCSTSFVNNGRLKRHIGSVHASKRSYPCNQCSFTCTTRSSLKIHVLYRHAREEDFKFQCPHCPLKFSVAQQLRNHQLRLHSTQKRFLCDMCNFSTNWSGTFETHMNEHLGVVHLCSVCGKSFASRHRLARHQQDHNDEGMFNCDRCRYSTNRRELLTRHYKVHTDERPFSCSQCSYRAKTRIRLSQHQRSHGDQRRFSCSLCDKTFKIKYHLMRHQDVHSGVVRECPLCDYKGPTLASFKRHVLLHDAERRWNCATCDKYFATRGELGHHTRKVHDSQSVAPGAE